ncbi:alpha/beta fold hydrolase [Bacteroidota bacterium]
MPAEKKDSSFRNKIIKIIAIILSLLIFISLIFYFLGLKINFIIGNEMDVSLTPLEQSFNVLYTDSPEVEFSLDLDHPFTCTAVCTSTLRDVSSDRVLFENKSIGRDKIDFSFRLHNSFKGEGQALYNFRVACHNKKSNICSTEEKDFMKIAIITVNYNMSQEEYEIKKSLEVSLNNLSDDLERIDYLMQQNDLLISSLKSNSSTITREEAAFRANQKLYRNDYISRLNQKNRFLKLWEEREYLLLIEQYSEAKIDFSLLKHSIEVLGEKILKTISEYNDALVVLQNFHFYKPEIQEMLNFYEQTKNDGAAQNISLLASKFDKLNYLAIAREFESYESFSTQVFDIERRLHNISERYSRDYKKLLVEGNNEIAFLKSSIATFNNETYDEQKSDETLKQACDRISSIISDAGMLHDNSTNSTFNEINLSSNEFYNNYCSDANLSVIEYFSPKVNLLEFSISTLFNISSEEQSFPVNKPQCCVFGDCLDCCEDDECKENYPLILLHGHAITLKNSPENSHYAFSLMQDLLEEEGYVNVGQLGAGSEYGDAFSDWSRIPAPVSVRVSYYYYISYHDVGQFYFVTQKTDRIENYALRLNEMIDIVLKKTNKDKVDIVAHSMGGLVLREYMRLFGTDKINKVIILGTPNHGVEGRIKNWCSIIGADNECSEMKPDSDFIYRLNSQNEVLDTVDSYTIRALGCDMGGLDGDGIVTGESVILPYTENYEIEGKCTDILNSNLHTEFIKPDIYPETFEIIKEILKK